MKTVLQDTFDLLTFRISRERILNFGWAHLAFGLVFTWIVGIGRYWDNPRVEFLQHLGIGSVVYIFLLSLLLYVVIKPLRVENWTYFRALTFISLVSPPAILYAIPVQYFTNLANEINALFLLIVSVWRVALLIFFLKRFAKMPELEILVAAFLPLCLLVVALVFLNVEKAVFMVMGGFDERTPNDGAFFLLNVISMFAMLLFPILLICYIVLIVTRFLENRRKNNPE